MSKPSAVPFDPKTEEVVHLAGDMDHGLAATVKLDKSKTEVSVRYRDFLMTCDLYRIEGAPMRLLLICPRCRNTLTITADKKQMAYESSRLPQFGGELSVEAFRCTWESDSSKDGRRMEFGLGLCNWTVAIDRNIAKDA